MSLALADLVNDYADAFAAIEATGPREASKNFKPGIGPLTEAYVVKLATEWLIARKPQLYSGAAPAKYPEARTTCDLVVGDWATEFKLIRPFGDNGRAAENWIENVLYPYPGNLSAIGDVCKLRSTSLAANKAVIVFGFEHAETRVSLEPAVRGFELLTLEIAGCDLGKRHTAIREPLVHPVHQRLIVHGWRVPSK